MHKVFGGFAAAALLTVGIAGVAGAESVINNGNAWVINPPAGGTYMTSIVDGRPSAFLVDVGGQISVDFGPGDLDGAIVYNVGDGVLNAPRP